MGPHHPATHGVLRLLVTLDGEVVQDLKPIIGYVHTGIEKTMEDKSYWKAIPVVERMDYLAYYFNAMAFCGATETLLEVEVPKRAQYLRVIHLELNRIMSHLVWLGTSVLDLGAISVSWYCFREREKILDLFEQSSGQRMHTRYIQVGGVTEDIPAGFEPKLRAFLKIMPERADQYGDLLNKNEIFLQRLRDDCPLDEGRCWPRRHRPLLRAAGNPWDLRKAQPYSPTRTSSSGSRSAPRRQLRPLRRAHRGDLRVLKIIEQALDGLPEGPYITEDRKVALPPRHELATSMEALIHHFKLVTEGFRVPPGEVYYPIEGPRGEYGCFCARTARASPRACTCATRPSSTSRRPRPWCAARSSPTSSPRWPCSTRSSAGWIADGPPLRARLPRPGLGRGRRPHEGPGRGARPRPRRRCPTTCARRSRRDGRYPDRHSAAIPALHAVQQRYGWCSPEGIEQAACVMRVTPGYLVSVATFYDMLETEPAGRHDVYVCTNISCSLNGADALLAASSSAAGDDPDFNVRHSSASAPATSRRWRRSTASTSARSSSTRSTPCSSRSATAQEPLPEKQLARRKSVDPGASA